MPVLIEFHIDLASCVVESCNKFAIHLMFVERSTSEVTEFIVPYSAGQNDFELISSKLRDAASEIGGRSTESRTVIKQIPKRTQKRTQGQALRCCPAMSFASNSAGLE